MDKTPESSITVEESEIPKRSPRRHIDSGPIPTDSLITVSLDSDTSEADPDGQDGSRDSRRNTITSGPENLQDALGEQLSRTRSSSLASGNSVDWNQLDKSEEQQPRDEVTDEATALLLARLEQENDALATNPKYASASNAQGEGRPPSMGNIRKIVQGKDTSSIRFSLLPEPPPVTDLEFWVALVKDYALTVRRLPTFTSKKIREGIPPILRGVVWSTMSGAKDAFMENEYERLCGLSSRYETEIKKDIGRCFPAIPLFQDPEGPGQRDLAMVLKCFSLYDNEVGYCQGLAFLVGPLLMHMSDKDAFCVLVKLMGDYNIRSCFLPDLPGLLLRIYQFNQLLRQQMPQLAAHLEALEVGDLYPTPWFLSFYANTCPFPMLERIYDVIFAEGASETVMRVALCLMKRNETRLLECVEMDHAMKILLNRSIWDPYGYSLSSADDLVNDFVSFAGVVTRESLHALEVTYSEGSASKTSESGAWRFIEKLWPRSSASIKSVALMSPTLSAPPRPFSALRRTPSKQSLASTLSSAEAQSDSSIGSNSTRATSMTRQTSVDGMPLITSISSFSGGQPLSPTKEDEDIIHELVMRVSDAEKQLARTTSALQKEREEREEDRRVVRPIFDRLRENLPPSPVDAPPPAENPRSSTLLSPVGDSPNDGLVDLLEAAEARFPSKQLRRQSSSFETRQSIQESRDRAREQLDQATSRIKDLLAQLSERDSSLGSKDQEISSLRQELSSIRNRVRDSTAREMRLEKTIQELRQSVRKPSFPSDYANEIPTLRRSDTGDTLCSTTSNSTASGLREFKLGRQSQTQQTFSKRISSLTVSSVISTENNSPLGYEELLQQLAQTKTNEALTKQEFEELKGKYDSLRRSMGVNTPETPATTPSSAHRPSPSEGGGGFFAITPGSGTSSGGFWGWGKRSFSATSPNAT